jgi:hypothetical protein
MIPITAERIAQQLGGAKKDGNGWKCLCPCHDDKDPSLHVSDKNGKILVYCFAGCSQDKVINELKRRKLWPGSESKFRQRPASLPKPQPKVKEKVEYEPWPPEKEITKYEYVDEDGRHLMEICRWLRPDGKKVIRPRHWDPQLQRYIRNAKDRDGKPIRRVLLHLPDVLQAKVVYVTEGEKSAEALVGLGVCGTTNPFGAKAPWLPQYTKSLKGKTVRLFPDNDDAGWKRVRKIADQLARAGIQCKIIELPGLKVKGDAYDWVEAGGNQQRLIELIKATAPYKRPQDDPEAKPPAPSRTPEGPPGVCLVWERADQIPAKPVAWLWPGRIPLGKVTEIAGPPGVNKSMLTISLAAVVTADETDDWRGVVWPGGVQRTGGPGDVLFISLEDDAEDILEPRLIAAGVVRERVHVLRKATLNWPSGEELITDFHMVRHVAAVEEKLKETPNAKLIVIDPVNRCLAGVETYNASQILAAQAPLQDLAFRYNVAVVLIHHLNKENKIADSYAWETGPRAVFIVVRDERDEGDSDKRFFLPKKTAVTSEAACPAMAYSIASKHVQSEAILDGKVIQRGKTIRDVGYVVWDEDPVTFTADDALANLKRQAKGDLGSQEKDVLTWLEDSGEPAKTGESAEALDPNNVTNILKRLKDAER